MSPPPITFERANPIFDRAHRSFHPLTRLVGVSVADDEVSLELMTDAGLRAFGSVTFPDPMVARVRWAVGGRPSERTTEMLVGPPARLALRVREESDAVLVDAGGDVLRLGRRPWRIEFGGFASEPADDSYFQPVSDASGWAVDDTGRARCYDTFALRAGEELFGLGERFVGPSLRGLRLSHWIAETYGTTTTPLVYKSVPLVISTEGYGVFYHHPEEATFDLGATSTASASVLIDCDEMDQLVILGTPKEILSRYTALTGRPTALPAWTYGVWMSRCMYADRAQITEVIDTARRVGFPVDVIHLDPKWLANRKPPAEACDFVWDEDAFGPIDELVSWLHSQGVRLSLWVNPYVADGTPGFVPEHLVEGGRGRDREEPGRGFVDLTGKGRDWWRAELARLVDAGVDAIKLDFGESLPPDVRLADGRSGAEVHNLYPLLAAGTAAEAGVTVAFTRAGTAGSQRHPLHWAGDSQSSWAGLAGTLRGGLAAAWSGFAFWTSDVGGFYWRDRAALRDQLGTPEGSAPGIAQPSPELYVRWLQLGMLCSHVRFHGVGPREPWAFGDEVLLIARRFAALRAVLVPYLLSCAEDATGRGWPVLRPMAFELPDDPTCRHLDTQYMLGPSVLVSPVLRPGGEVTQYVPAGRWHDPFRDEEVEGPRWRSYVVPLSDAAVLIRDGEPTLDAVRAVLAGSEVAK